MNMPEGQQRPSFVGRWLAGGGNNPFQEEQESEEPPPPSFIKRLFQPTEGTRWSSGGSTGSKGKEELIQRLKEDLHQIETNGEDASDRTITLTTRELRLLLDLPLPTDKTGEIRFDPTPLPVERLPSMNQALLDAWDFTSDEDLSGDEIQAIMIALKADHEERLSCLSSISNDDEQDEGISSVPLPPSLTNSQRQVTIEQILTQEGPQFLVTLDGLQTDSQKKLWNHPYIKNSTKPSLATRQFSIQSLPKISGSEEEGEEEEETKKVVTPPTSADERWNVAVPSQAPRMPTPRQASVQILPRDDSTSDVATSTRYMISLPALGLCRDSSNSDNSDKRPTPARRQVTVQRSKTNIHEENGGGSNKNINNNSSNNHHIINRRSLMKGYHPMSVRINGGKTFETFGLGPLEC